MNLEQLLLEDLKRRNKLITLIIITAATLGLIFNIRGTIN